MNKVLDFIENNTTFIKTYEEGKIKFKLRDYQIKMIQDFEEHRFNLIFHARRLGITETLAFYALSYAMNNPEKKIEIVLNNREFAAFFVKKIVYQYKNLRSVDFNTEALSYSKYSIKFINGSEIWANTGMENTGCGESQDLIIMDGAGWFKDFETAFASIFPSISENGKCIIASTGYSPNNSYLHDLWKNKDNGFNKIFLNWDFYPDATEEWKKQIEKNYSKEAIKSQFSLEDI